MSHPENVNAPLPAPRSLPRRPDTMSSVALPSTRMPAAAIEPTAGAAPPGLTAAPTATTLWHSFRRRWLVALLVALIGSLAAVALALELVPGTYTAQAVIKVAPPAPLPELMEPNIDLRTFRDDQAGFLQSDPVLRAALNRKDVQALPLVQAHVRNNVDSVNWLRKAFKTDFTLGPSLLRVTMHGEDPEELKVLVGALTDEYVRLSKANDLARREDAKRLLRDQKTKYRTELQSKVNLRNEALDRLKLPRPEIAKIRLDQVDRELQQVRKTFIDLTVEEGKTSARLKAAKDQLKSLVNLDVSDALLRKYFKDDEITRKYLEEVSKIDKEIRDLFNSGAPNNPIVVDQRIQLERSRSQMLTNLKRYRRESIPDVRRQLQAEKELEIAEMESQVQALRQQKTELDKTMAELQQLLTRLSSPPANSEIDALEREIQSKENSLVELEKRLASLDMAPLGANIQPLQEEVDLPRRIDRSRQLKFAGLAGLGSFGLLLLGVSLLEFRARKINNAEEVIKGLAMPVVGTLPGLPLKVRQAAAGSSTPRDVYWQNLLAEAVDGIRTLLLHSAKTEGLQVVMVTSACNGEGKTSLASQLAASLARAWKKTLLIDADLRNPALHKLFGQSLEPGFSEALRGELPLADTVRPTSVSRLWVMPAGQWDSHTVQALAQDGVKAMLAQLKEQYDFIIVDSCPVLPVADALLLGQHVDAVLFSVLRDISRTPLVYAAQQRMQTLGIRSLGAVVIGDAGSTHGYPYPALSGS